MIGLNLFRMWMSYVVPGFLDAVMCDEEHIAYDV